ncbi:PTS lactose/cellobiose transporter subunit IIA [Thorsellia anophelis]|uniref:PTS system, cellobiose-specific IIA component n=1 Tax=Thorsellia anophelis DSM 18579 TaxID=1123402 RepID=A0A1I0ADY9_9GAMM|nr:PTS lactose/cellobiose transporter subunit IIA [Thorsellia anophelis]SES92461.1 PTS system, cellobiose-specific IIA component [Thorsellia anophelis DSM 18579]
MSDIDLSNMEQTVMELIINSGEARSYAMEALAAARAGDFDKADECIKSAREAEIRAHSVQTQLIGLDMGEGKVPVNLILVHAQDHIMTSMLAKEMAQEMINLYRVLNTNGIKLS